MLRLTVLAGLALLAAPAQAAHCNSLFAAYVAGRAGMTDCGTHFTVDSAPCVANETADQCATRVYNDAESLTLAPGSGAMTAKWLAPCLDGTNTCPQRELVCYDGTRPMVYVDKAVDMNGGEMYSNGWVFFMGGEGGPCTGDSCWDYYVDSADPAMQKSMSTYHPKYFTTEAAHVPGNGLMSAQATIGGAPNNFRHFNRVKFNRCSDGASAALQNVVVKDSAGVPVGTATVFHDGDAIWEGLAHYLATAAGRDLGGGGDSYTDGNPDLPPLANATTILLAASSDASHWLIENADRLADLFHTIAPNAEVRIVVDGYFPPMLENEARYNANIGTNVFDGAWGNPLNELLPVGLSGTREYNETRYVMRATNGNSQSWLDRGVRIDADCVAQHGVGAEICYDQLHVLLNHVQTPFFIVADQRDLVVRDTPLYAVDPTYRFTENEYRRRVVDQALDVLSLYPTAACNPSSGWNTALFLARPDSRKHTHFDTDAKFGTTMSHCDGMATLATWTLSQALHSWLVFDTAFDAVERPGNGAGVHWVTAGHLCGAPQ